MATKKARSHVVAIRIKFDAEVTPKEARYAAWNHFDGYTMYGDGKPRRNEDPADRAAEPYGIARTAVRR